MPKIWNPAKAKFIYYFMNHDNARPIINQYQESQAGESELKEIIEKTREEGINPWNSRLVPFLPILTNSVILYGDYVIPHVPFCAFVEVKLSKLLKDKKEIYEANSSFRTGLLNITRNHQAKDVRQLTESEWGDRNTRSEEQALKMFREKYGARQITSQKDLTSIKTEFTFDEKAFRKTGYAYPSLLCEPFGAEIIVKGRIEPEFLGRFALNEKDENYRKYCPIYKGKMQETK